MEYVSPEGLRQDGRRAQELRQLKCEIGLLNKADGSATFEMGNTKVLATVLGPKSGARTVGMLSQGQVRCEVAIAAFSSGERRRRFRRDRRVQDLAAAVQGTFKHTILLDLLVKSEVEVFLQVLQADGGERAACINAAMLAIANAGIPVRDLVAACNVGFIESTALLDLNFAEVTAQAPQVTMAAYPSLDKIATLEQSGEKISIDDFEEVCSLAQEGCKAVAQFMRNCLLAHTNKLAVCQGVGAQ